MRRTESNEKRQTYEPSGDELRIYWDEQTVTRQDMDGNTYTVYTYWSVALSIYATRDEIKAAVLAVDPTADAQALADGWTPRPNPNQGGGGHDLGENGRTLIVPTAQVELARSIAAAFGPGGVGMFIAPLSPNGDEPATHYCSTGYIPPQFAHMVPCQYWAQDEDGNWEETGEDPGDPQAVYDAVTEAGLQVTLAQIEALFAAADVTQQNPYVAFGRMGIEQVRTDDPV